MSEKKYTQEEIQRMLDHLSDQKFAKVSDERLLAWQEQLGKKHSEITKEICRQKSIGLNVGRKFSKETRKKISEIAKNRTFSEETRKKMSDSQKARKQSFNEDARKNAKKSLARPILCYLVSDNSFVGEFPSIADAARDLNINRGGILKNLKGLYKKPKMYIFAYKSD